MAWITRCLACGYESDESFERHFDAVDDITKHLIRSSCEASTTETEIRDADTDTDND